MTPEQMRLLRESFERVLSIADVITELFYKKLFDLDPSLRHLFRADTTEQSRKLMTMLQMAVDSLDHPDEPVADVAEAGKRHARYGVEDAHYQTVGEALIWTLEKGLGDAFTSEARQAWVDMYGLLSSMMQNAAHRWLMAPTYTPA